MSYYTNELGYVYGPYGGIGTIRHIQREDLEQVFDTCIKLFRWAKQFVL